MNLIRGQKTQHGQNHADYSRNANLDILSNLGQTIMRYEITAIWPGTIPELSFTGTSADAMPYNIGFKFNEFVLIGGSALDMYGPADTSGGFGTVTPS